MRLSARAPSEAAPWRGRAAAPPGCHAPSRGRPATRAAQHGAVNTLAALLQALEHHQAPRQVDLLRRQGQGFGNAAASCVQHAAESADLARGLGGGGHKSAALLLGEVEAAALGVVKLHARLGLIDTVHMNSVTLSRRLKNSDIPSKHLSHRIDSSFPSRFVRHSGATIIRPPQRAELQ